MKTLKSVIIAMLAAYFAIAPFLYAGETKQEKNKENDNKTEFDIDHNALDISLTNRLLTSLNLNYNNFQISYDGLNESNNLQPDYHFGRQVFSGGKKDAKTKFATVIKTTSDGIIDAKAGFRNLSLIEALGGYGSLETTMDKSAANVTFLYGRPIINKFSIEIYHDSEFNYDRTLSFHTEIQPIFSFSNKFSGYSRLEMDDFNIRNALFMFGMTYSLTK